MPNIMRDRYFGLTDASIEGTFVLPAANDWVLAETVTTPSGEYGTVDDGNDYGKGVVQNICRTVSGEQPLSFLQKFRWEDEIAMRTVVSALGQSNYAFTVDSPEVNVNKHAFKLVKVLDPLALFSAAIDFPGNTLRGMPSATITEVLIEIADNVFKITVNFTGDKWEVQTGPMTVTTQTPRSKCFQLADGLCIPRINELSDTDLDSGDAQTKVSNVRVRITRDVLSLDPVQGGAAARGGVTDNGPPEVFLELDYVSTYVQNIPWLAGHQAGTIYKGDVTMVSPINMGASATPYTFFMQFPGLELRTAPVHAEETPMPTTAVFKMIEPETPGGTMTETLPNGYFYNELPTLGY